MRSPKPHSFRAQKSVWASPLPPSPCLGEHGCFLFPDRLSPASELGSALSGILSSS